MKRLLYLLPSIVFVFAGCTNFIKITRTISKTITLNFEIDQTGAFQKTTLISSQDLINLFETDPFTQAIGGYQFERFDVKGIRVDGTLNQQKNTATQVNITATVTSSFGSTVLLNQTKVIRLGDSNLGLDLLSAATGGESISLHNAISTVNSLGVEEIKMSVNNYFNNISTSPLVIRLNGTTLSNQRLSGTLVIQVDGSISFTKCESAIEILPGDECYL